METECIHNYNELDQLGMYVGKEVTEDAKIQTASVWELQNLQVERDGELVS